MNDIKSYPAKNVFIIIYSTLSLREIIYNVVFVIANPYSGSNPKKRKDRIITLNCFTASRFAMTFRFGCFTNARNDIILLKRSSQ
ncbi:MAG: hypothetical protein LBH30_04940 [Prevotellaceae bacterium]|nr:hypothetical protein [Prevotellaceae bacterium]